MIEQADIVVKIGTNWFINIDDYEHKFKYGDGTRILRFGPYHNEATARLAELAFFKGLEDNEL